MAAQKTFKRVSVILCIKSKILQDNFIKFCQIVSLCPFAIIFNKSKAKKKGTIIVPEPTKISEQEFRQKAPVKTIFQKAAPIVKKLFAKKKAVGNFPDTI